MDEKRQTNEHQQMDERFRALLGALETIKNQYVAEAGLKWYDKHIWVPRFFFYLSGTLLILLSVSLPYLATLEGPWRTIVLPIVALAVAGLTGLSSFFKWDISMRLHIQTKFQLRFWLSMWELQITEAKYDLDVESAIKKALQATQQLLEKAQNTLSTEVEEHYQSIKPPKVQESQ